MNFESISKEILDKVGDSTDHLFSLELIKKVHTFTKDYKFNFDNEVKDAAQITTLELASAEKDKGTKFFRNNMLQESCETYTGCLKMCHQLSDSEGKSKLIYQVYANRYTYYNLCQIFYLNLKCISDLLFYSKLTDTRVAWMTFRQPCITALIHN